MNIFEKARALGLPRPEYHGMSAKQLRAVNPQHAERWADFIRDNKDALVQAVAGRLASGAQ